MSHFSDPRCRHCERPGLELLHGHCVRCISWYEAHDGWCNAHGAHSGPCVACDVAVATPAPSTRLGRIIGLGIMPDLRREDLPGLLRDVVILLVFIGGMLMLAGCRGCQSTNPCWDECAASCAKEGKRVRFADGNQALQCGTCDCMEDTRE